LVALRQPATGWVVSRISKATIAAVEGMGWLERTIGCGVDQALEVTRGRAAVGWTSTGTPGRALEMEGMQCFP
jgi:hypothetical protein